MLYVLTRHELRTLRQNWTGSAVLGLIVAVACLVRLTGEKREAADQVCYVVYWQEDDWVRALAAAAPKADLPSGARIEVAPAKRFTNPSGLIHYPRHSHSIQLRPPEQSGTGKWLIWYWHGDTDPSVLEPFISWFWEITRKHFGLSPAWDEKISSLHTSVATPLGTMRARPWETGAQSVLLEVGLVWLTIFFAGCCLPILSLSQDREHSTHLSIVLTPAGWRGYARAKWLCYFVLATVLAVVVSGILRPALLAQPSLWMTIVFGAGAYLGLAFVIGSLCWSVASATAGLMFYGIVSGVVFQVALRLMEVHPGFWVIAMGLLDLDVMALLAGVRGLTSSEVSNLWIIAALATVAGVWNGLGWWCYRRSCRA